MNTGVFIGRFQPFHLGHLSAVKQCLKKVDRLIIGIGSSQYSGEPQNPYTAEERSAMIRAALAEAGIPESACEIILVPDIHNDARWPAHVQSLTPPFDVVFTNSPVVRELFEKYTQVAVEGLTLELDISATEVRRRMKEKEDWQSLVPPAVTKILTRP